MKPFNFEDAKAGKPVCTRSGHKVRIICFDRKDKNYPIIALMLTGSVELIMFYTKEGKFRYNSTEESSDDLMMADVIHTGYINIYKIKEEARPGRVIFETEENAKMNSSDADYLDTIKIQWKEQY